MTRPATAPAAGERQLQQRPAAGVPSAASAEDQPIDVVIVLQQSPQSAQLGASLPATAPTTAPAAK